MQAPTDIRNVSNSSVTNEMASNIALVTTTQTVAVAADGSDIKTLQYLQLQVPPNETCPAVKVIQVECSSHDQGWATADGSWTWSDLVVKNAQGLEVYRERNMFVNLRANDQFQLHVKIFDQNSEAVKNLTPGNQLILELNAQFPGWVNNANYGRLAVYY